MDYWAKYIYGWGIFSAEVYPRSSIAFLNCNSRTVRMSEFPVHSMIYRWVNKFRTHGPVHNLIRTDTNRQSHSGRPKSPRTPHNIAAVRDSFVHSISKAVRRRSQELGINRESVRRFLIADLHMYPYRIQIEQKLIPDDMRKRVIMCQWFCDKIDTVPDFPSMFFPRWV